MFLPSVAFPVLPQDQLSSPITKTFLPSWNRAGLSFPSFLPLLLPSLLCFPSSPPLSGIPFSPPRPSSTLHSSSHSLLCSSYSPHIPSFILPSSVQPNQPSSQAGYLLGRDEGPSLLTSFSVLLNSLRVSLSILCCLPPC